MPSAAQSRGMLRNHSARRASSAGSLWNDSKREYFFDLTTVHPGTMQWDPGISLKSGVNILYGYLFVCTVWLIMESDLLHDLPSTMQAPPLFCKWVANDVVNKIKNFNKS